MKMIKSSITAIALSLCTLNAADVLATVNGHSITKEDANTYLKATGSPQTFDQAAPANQKQIVERLVERELFIEIASKSDIEKDSKFVELLKDTKNDLLVSQWMKKKYDSIVVSDSDAKSYYEKHTDEYKTQNQVQASHILVKTDGEAIAIIEELKPLKDDALKSKFEELAKSKSTGPSGKNGGDLGYFDAKSMVKPFSDAAFSMKAGEVTMKPVKTQFGYHIIYVVNVKEAGAEPYDKVKPQIIEALKQKQFQDELQKKIDNLKSKAKIEIKSDKK